MINAQTQIDTTQKGNIKVILDDVKKGSKKDVTFEIYKVADLKDGLLELVGDFKATNIDLNNVKTAEEVEKAAKTFSAIKTKATQTKTTLEDGIILFEDLEVGGYLVKATNTSNYDDIQPFVVSIPRYDAVSGSMVYDIESHPKHSPKPELPTTSDNIKFPIIFLCSVSIMGIIILIKSKKTE